MTLPTALAVAVIVFAVPLNWYVALRLLWLSHGAPGIWTLRSHAFAALTLAVIVTVFGIVFVNNGMAVPFLSPEQTMVLTRAAIIALSIPGLYWLYLVRRSWRDLRILLRWTATGRACRRWRLVGDLPRMSGLVVRG